MLVADRTATATTTATTTATATATATSTATATPTSEPAAPQAATSSQPPAPFVSEPPAPKGLPVIRTAGSYTATKTRFRRVLVTAAAGFRVDASCSRRACKATRSGGKGAPVRVKRMERAYPPGVVLTIRVTAPDATGKCVQIRTRRGKPPLRTDRCLGPGGAKAVACEAK